ncbi:MAG: bifunctional precorrin-2 dehydrogenase/sirohydrochlorin ferrochelatase [Syntrophales bacterium]|nr:bifunctional precorrin-2 dehydrogenase/sirohydrochlorin ferrochelatase [Syntrophales bacterium]
MKYYPVFLKVEDRLCVVVGGGAVAERKVLRLLQCGARVMVVSPHLTPGLEDLCQKKKIEVVREAYHPSHLKGAFLIIGATDDIETNEQIFRDSLKENVLVNIVDDPQKCNFILPSLLERGDLSIAISTAGKSPALARKIRQDLSHLLGPEYAILLKILGNLRKRYREVEPDGIRRMRTYERLLSSNLLEAIRHQQWDKVQAIIREHTGLHLEIEEERG